MVTESKECFSLGQYTNGKFSEVPVAITIITVLSFEFDTKQIHTNTFWETQKQ